MGRAGKIPLGCTLVVPNVAEPCDDHTDPQIPYNCITPTSLDAREEILMVCLAWEGNIKANPKENFNPGAPNPLHGHGAGFFIRSANGAI